MANNDGKELTGHITIDKDRFPVDSAIYMGPKTLMTVEYCGNHIYRNGKLERILNDYGYYANGAYHFNITDYHGNIRAVIREDGILEETSSYYPYGGLMGSGSMGVQPYKYGGKELDRENGLDLYDSHARMYDPIIGRTTTIDPLAEKYTHLSPYLWCAANPLKYVDPSGRFLFENISNFNSYPVISVMPSNYKNDKALLRDYQVCKQENMPIVLVDDVSDFANALADLQNRYIMTSVFSINSHGSTGSFYIGNEHVNAESDYSVLRTGLKHKTVFINACNTTLDTYGEAMIENFSIKTESTVIGSKHPILSGYKYDGSLNLNYHKSIPLKNNNSNKYMISSEGTEAETITNLRMTKKDIIWDEKIFIPFKSPIK